MDTVGAAMDLLGAGRVFRSRAKGEGDLRRLLRAGLPAESVEHLIGSLPAAQRDSWQEALGVPPSGRLSPEHSERVVRFAYILALADEVWGGKARAYAFLAKPHPLLDGEAPLRAMESEWGARAVESLLRKVQFGLPV